jgi:hypothetical protein
MRMNTTSPVTRPARADAPASGRARRPVAAVLRRRSPALAAACLLLVPAAAFSGAPEQHYRLAGIVAGGPGATIAVIELPDGRQRSYRTGDALDAGTIREITPASVRIGLPDDDLILRLRGSPHRAASRAAGAPATEDDDIEPRGVPEEAAAEGAVRNQQLGSNEASRLLAAAERARRPDGDSPAGAAAAQLNDILEIPADAVVLAVDEVHVASPAAALEALAARLNEDAPAAVTVSGAGEVRTIVLTPDAEQ